MRNSCAPYEVQGLATRRDGSHAALTEILYGGEVSLDHMWGNVRIYSSDTTVLMSKHTLYVILLYLYWPTQLPLPLLTLSACSTLLTTLLSH